MSFDFGAKAVRFVVDAINVKIEADQATSAGFLA